MGKIFEDEPKVRVKVVNPAPYPSGVISPGINVTLSPKGHKDSVKELVIPKSAVIILQKAGLIVQILQDAPVKAASKPAPKPRPQPAPAPKPKEEPQEEAQDDSPPLEEQPLVEPPVEEPEGAPDELEEDSGEVLPDEVQKLIRMSKSALKKMCKKNKLDSSGRKIDMAWRIAEALDLA